MGKALAEAFPIAARTYDEATEAVGIDLRSLCWEGPQAELDRTANAQPAILTTSIAALRAALDRGLAADDPICLGHSLGEFSALVAAGALKLADAVRLVRRRGELMQKADPSGGMAAVIGLDADVVARAIEGTGLVIANDNAPGQVVISGALAGIAAATAALKQAGAKRLLPLRVSAAFHSPAMRPVVPELAKAIAATAFSKLRYTVITNVDAEPHEHAADLPPLLEKQAWSPVRWVASIRRASGEGATHFVEFGLGTVLIGLAKRILPDATTANVGDPASLEEALRVR